MDENLVDSTLLVEEGRLSEPAADAGALIAGAAAEPSEPAAEAELVADIIAEPSKPAAEAELVDDIKSIEEVDVFVEKLIPGKS